MAPCLPRLATALSSSAVGLISMLECGSCINRNIPSNITAQLHIASTTLKTPQLHTGILQNIRTEAEQA